MSDKVEIFNDRMMEHINPGSSAKELVEKIVRSALEVEFGAEFTVNAGFAKMVSKIADSLVTNPELRRQALSVAGNYITKKMEIKKSGDVAASAQRTEKRAGFPIPIDKKIVGPNIPLNI